MTTHSVMQTNSWDKILNTIKNQNDNILANLTEELNVKVNVKMIKTADKEE